MSIWGDIHRRNSGEVIRTEDFTTVYPGKDSVDIDHQLDTGEYKDIKYTIYTNGQYPYISISMMHLDMSLFSGCGLVRIKRDNNEYFEIQRVVSGNTVNFIYFCNQKTDYIDGRSESNTSELQSRI